MATTLGRPKLYEKPIETKFTKDQLGALSRLAAGRGVTRSEVIRAAVDRLLAEEAR